VVYIPRGFVRLHQAFAEFAKTRKPGMDPSEATTADASDPFGALGKAEMVERFYEAIAEGDLRTWLQSELTGGRGVVAPRFWRAAGGRKTMIRGSTSLYDGPRGDVHLCHFIVAKADLEMWLANGASVQALPPLEQETVNQLEGPPANLPEESAAQAGATQPITKRQARPPQATVDTWMLNHARAALPHITKLGIARKECMVATGARWEQATKAHQNLPDGLRISQGRPKTKRAKSERSI
jgi:hypothetical protein